MTVQGDGRQVLVGHLGLGGVQAEIPLGVHREPAAGGGGPDQLLPLEPGSPERLQRVMAASAERWGRPRAEVEEEMVARHRGHLQVVR